MRQEPAKLRRSISWVQGVALTIGAVLGSGVLILPVSAAELAGPASLISWLLMGVLTVPFIITLGKLAGSCPDAGGIAAYAKLAFGRRAGTAVGWLFFGTVPVGAPVVALIGANSIGAYMSFTQMGIALIAALMLMMAIVLNYRGISLSGNVQLVVVGIIVCILIAVIIVALPEVDRQAFTPFAPKGWMPVGVTMTVLFWAFVGWEMIGHLAEEFMDPVRDILLSLAISAVVINILYFLLAFVIVGTGSYLGQDKTVAFAAIVSRGWGSWAGAIVSILGFIVCYGTIHTYVAGFSRLVYALSRQGEFTLFLDRLHPVYNTPYRVLLTLAPAFILVLFVQVYFKLELIFYMQFTSAIFIGIYIIGMASAVKLLKQGMGRYCGIISLIVCIAVYGFTGWTGLYPVVMVIIGWIMGSRRDE